VTDGRVEAGGDSLDCQEPRIRRRLALFVRAAIAIGQVIGIVFENP